jgi:hypothetical protein
MIRTLHASSLAVVLSVLLSSNAVAREGFYAGLGIDFGWQSGDLDGDHAYVDPLGNQYLVGSITPENTLAPGTDVNVVFGVGVGPFLAVEALAGMGSRPATYPHQTNSEAFLTWAMFAVRGNLPLIPDHLEVFGRWGPSIYSVEYNHYGLLARSGAPTDVTYTGSGSIFGLGIGGSGEHWGLELGSLWHDAEFDSAKISGQPSFKLPQHLHETFTMLTLTGLYHF